MTNNSTINSEQMVEQTGEQPRGQSTQTDIIDPEYRTIKYTKTLSKENYNDKDTIISTSLDILALYLQGEKILYTESKVYCEQILNILMLPAIFISALCTVLSVALKDYYYGVYIVSALAALNSFILAIISYLKLDAKAEAHKTSAYQYAKLQSTCEFNSGKVLFFSPENQNDEETREKICIIVDNIEKKVEEIKETNKFILPESIRFFYNSLYSRNVFSSVKKLQITELVLQNDLKTILNRIIWLQHSKKLKESELDDIRFKINILSRELQNITSDFSNEIVQKESNKMELIKTDRDINDRLKELTLEIENTVIDKEKKIKELIEFRKKYTDIEDEYREEIDTYIEKQQKRWTCFSWLKT
jgi:hypothetical protein